MEHAFTVQYLETALWVLGLVSCVMLVAPIAGAAVEALVNRAALRRLHAANEAAGYTVESIYGEQQ